MLGTSKNELKASLDHTLKRYHNVIAGVLFAFGILLRLLATNNSGIVWQIVGV